MNSSCLGVKRFQRDGTFFMILISWLRYEVVIQRYLEHFSMLWLITSRKSAHVSKLLLPLCATTNLVSLLYIFTKQNFVALKFIHFICICKKINKLSNVARGFNNGLIFNTTLVSNIYLQWESIRLHSQSHFSIISNIWSIPSLLQFEIRSQVRAAKL